MPTGNRSLAEQICYVVNSIPAGQTMTYRAVARSAGFPTASVAVVTRILQENRRGGLPWWRVVGHHGKLDPTFAEAQAKKLAADGVVVVDGKLPP
jgi:alkylated DNA nucleotide flippase Atl1